MVRFWRFAAVFSVVLALAVNIYIAWGSSLSFMYDEIGTVIHGRTVLGLDAPQLNTPGYYPGWGVLLAPLWLVTSNVFTFYKLAIVVGLAISMLTIWPLARVAVRLSGVTPAQGVVAGAIVMALPPRAVQSDYILSERLITLLVVVATLVAFRLYTKPTYRGVLLLSLLTGLSLFSHARMQVFVAAVALWLVFFLVRKWQIALVGLVATGVLAVVANRAALWFHEQLVPWKFLQAEGFFEKVAEANPRFWVDTFAGEAWTQMVGSFGVVVVGVVVVTAMFWKELRSRQVGQAGFVLIAAGSMYVLSCLNWGNEYSLFTMEWRRFDYWIYGRYIDPVFAVLVLAGVCAAIQAITSRAVLVWSWVLVAGISLVTILVVAPDAPTWAYATPAHIPGAAPWWWTLPDGEFPQPGPIPSFTNDNRFWLIATVSALVPLAIWTLLAALPRLTPRVGQRLSALRADRVRSVVVTALVLALGTTASAVADTASDEFHGRFNRATPVVGELRSVLADHPDADVAYDNNCPRRPSSMNAERNWLMWWMLPTIVKRQWEWGDDVVFSCPTGEPAYVTGAVMLRDRPFPYATVWILPGDLLDSLRESGDLPPIVKTVK